MRNRALLSAAALVVLAGCAAGHATVLGAPPPQQARIVAVKDLKAGSVVVRGKMVEKCPIAGCWFMLRDRSGLIKVDTKGAGFVVTNVPLNTEVTVAGKFTTSGEHLVAASGLSY